MTPLPGLTFESFAGARHGARVAAGDVDGDGIADILCARGPGATEAASFRGYRYGSAAVAWLPGFDVDAFPTLYGGNVGSGDPDRDGRVDLVATPGVDPAADTRIRAFTYTGSALDPQGPGIVAFPGASHGAHGGAGHFDD